MTRLIVVAVTIAIAAIGLVLYSEWDTFDPESIRCKRVLVTGASSGIGEELAYQYSKLGASVVITARRADLLQKVASKCKQLGAKKVEYVVADMAKPEDRLKVVSDTEKHLGGLDQLILNHALIVIGGSWLGTPQNFTLLDTQLQVNFVSYVDIASQCMKMLSVTNGNIGVVSSISGSIPLAGFLSYSADKFALQAFFGGLRHELRIRHVDVSVTICVLGHIDTEIARDIEKNIPGSLPPAAAVDDTAMAIINGVTGRHREIYVPNLSRFLVYIHKFFPDFIETYFASSLLG